MKTLILVNSTPYGTEGPYNALRLTEALLASGAQVDLFLMGDGVHTARRGQDPRDAHKSIEGMLAGALSAGADVAACGTWMGWTCSPSTTSLRSSRKRTTSSRSESTGIARRSEGRPSSAGPR